MAGAAHQIDGDRAEDFVRPDPFHVVEGLEHFVGKVEGVPVAGEVEIRGRGEDEIREGFLAAVAVVQGEQDALGRAVMPLIDKGAKPALERSQVLVVIAAGKGEALAARRAGGAPRNLGQAVDEKEVLVVHGNVVPHVCREGQDGDARRPAFAGFVRTVVESLLDDFLRGSPRLAECGDRFGDEEGTAVLKPLFERALATGHEPQAGLLLLAGRDADPCVAIVADFDGKGF